MSTGPVATVATWARGLEAGRRVVLRCSAGGPRTVPGPGGDVVVRWEECLRSLTAAELAELVAATPQLVLELSGCPCARGPEALVPAAVRLLGPVLQDLGAADRLIVETASSTRPAGDRGHGADADAAPQYASTVRSLPVGRRALFSWAAPKGPRAADGPTTAAAHDHHASPRLAPAPASGHGEAQEQVRLARALQELGRQLGGKRSGPASRPPAASPEPRSRRLTSSGCTGCWTCVRSCPTSALALRPTDRADHAGQEPPPASSALALEADLAACTGCGRCLALCPVQALADEGPLTWADLAVPGPTLLETVVVRRCSRCRTPFGGEGELCQVCRLRQTDPFGSWLPPGYVGPRVYAPPAPADSVPGLEQQVAGEDLRDR